MLGQLLPFTLLYPHMPSFLRTVVDTLGNLPTFCYSPTQSTELETEQHHDRQSLVSAALSSFELWQATPLVFPTGVETYSYL